MFNRALAAERDFLIQLYVRVLKKGALYIIRTGIYVLMLLFLIRYPFFSVTIAVANTGCLLFGNVTGRFSAFHH